MGIMSDVMSRTMSDVISDVDVTGGVVYNYNYNGSTMYATFPEWTPLNAVFSYGADVVVDVAATGVQQNILYGDNGVGEFSIQVNTDGVIRGVFKDTSGANRVLGPIVTAVDGGSYSIRLDFSPSGVAGYLNGVQVVTTTNVPDLAALSSIAASLTPNEYFDGTISNVFCKSSSPMQNVNVMAGNGVDRWASIPEITFAGDYRIGQWVRSDLSGIVRMFGNENSLSTPRAYITDTSGQAVFVASPTIQSAIGVIKANKDHYVVCERIGTNTTLYVDGVSVATSNTAITDTYSISSIGNQNGNCGIGVVSHTEIKDLGTGITHTYNNTDNYEVLGSELLVAPTTVGAPWVDNGDGTFTIDGSQGNTAVSLGYVGLLKTDQAVGDKYFTQVEIINTTAGEIRVSAAGGTTAGVSGVGIKDLYPTVFTAGNTNFNFQAVNSFAGTIRPISVKQATVILPDSTVTEYGDELWVDPVVGTAWTDDGGGSYTLVTDGGAGELEILTVETGKTYAYSFDMDSYSGTGTLSIRSGALIELFNTVETHTGVFLADADQCRFLRSSGGNAFTSTISNISVKEVIAIADTQDGEWVNAAIGDLEYLPLTDRLYKINEGSGVDIADSYNASSMKYYLDGVDQYFNIPPKSVEVGDTLTMKWIAQPSYAGQGSRMFFGNATGAAPRAFINTANKILNLTGCTATLDGNVATHQVTVLPTDGLEHTFVFTITGAGTIDAFGAQLNGLNPANFPIYDIDINGERFYPVNEGSGAVIRDTLNPETELVTNGEFDTDSDWTYTLNSGTAVIGGGQLTLTRGAGGDCIASQSLTGFVVGKQYLIELDVDSTSGSNRVNLFGGLAINYTDATGIIRATVTATATGSTLSVQKGGVIGGTATFNSISVKEYTNGTIVNEDDADWRSTSSTSGVIINEDDSNWNKA